MEIRLLPNGILVFCFCLFHLSGNTNSESNSITKTMLVMSGRSLFEQREPPSYFLSMSQLALMLPSYWHCQVTLSVIQGTTSALFPSLIPPIGANGQYQATLNPTPNVTVPHLLQFSNSEVNQRLLHCKPATHFATPFSACQVFHPVLPSFLLLFHLFNKRHQKLHHTNLFWLLLISETSLPIKRRYIPQHHGTEERTLFSWTLSFQLHSNLFEKLFSFAGKKVW